MFLHPPKNCEMKADQNNKYDITKTWSLVQVWFKFVLTSLRLKSESLQTDKLGTYRHTWQEKKNTSLFCCTKTNRKKGRIFRIFGNSSVNSAHLYASKKRMFVRHWRAQACISERNNWRTYTMARIATFFFVQSNRHNHNEKRGHFLSGIWRIKIRF